MIYQKQISQSFWQGMAKLVILHQAGLAPLYGGRLRKYLSALGYDISPGSLYPLLHNLEKQDFLRSRIKIFKGRVRKYYELTPQGQDCLKTLRRELEEIVREVILGEPPGDRSQEASSHKEGP
jgi:DNA-binding PadR family transcriptional regulator